MSELSARSCGKLAERASKVKEQRFRVTRTAQVGMRLFVERALQMLPSGEPEQATSMAKYYCAEPLPEIVAK